MLNDIASLQVVKSCDFIPQMVETIVNAPDEVDPPSYEKAEELEQERKEQEEKERKAKEEEAERLRIEKEKEMVWPSTIPFYSLVVPFPLSLRYLLLANIRGKYFGDFGSVPTSLANNDYMHVLT